MTGTRDPIASPRSHADLRERHLPRSAAITCAALTCGVADRGTSPAAGQQVTPWA
jgi:hypothetical protein